VVTRSIQDARARARAKIAIADGAASGASRGRNSKGATSSSDSSRGGEYARSLPLEALPLARGRIVLLHRLGPLDGGGPHQLPCPLVSRLGRPLEKTIDLARGEDTAPLSRTNRRARRRRNRWTSLSRPSNRCSLRSRSDLASFGAPRSRGEAGKPSSFLRLRSFDGSGARRSREGSHSVDSTGPRFLTHPICSAIFRTKARACTLAAPVTGLVRFVALHARFAVPAVARQGKTQRAPIRARWRFSSPKYR